MTPIAISAGKVNTWQMAHANTGMIVYCARTPIKILHRFSNLIVSPIPNIAMPSKNDV